MASKEAAARKHLMEKGKPKKATKLRRLGSERPKKGKK